jgi:hypothetical protein
MRRVHLERPFTAGMNTELPAHAIGPQNSAFAQDLLSPNDVAVQRHGWAYDGSVADSATNLKGVYRAKFVLADVTRTITTDVNKVYLHNSAGSGTKLEDWAETIPRAVYRDELLLCAQDGQTPMLRYSGAAVESDGIAAGTTIIDSGEFNATSGTYSADVAPGWYLVYSEIAPYCLRVAEKVSTTSIVLEDVKWGQTLAGTGAFTVQATGLTTPCVSVYNASTMSMNGGTGVVTGNGTKWDTGDWGAVDPLQDAIMLQVDGSASYFIRNVISVTDDDTLTVLAGGTNSTDLPYSILRSCPFKDVAAHKGSLWGTGVAQFPDRVYYSPQGWNPSIPPGFTVPHDPIFGNSSENANDFLLEFIDVPSPFDGDGNVAILESPNPLLVLKRHSVYGVYGEYPTVASSLIADGAGCIDIRSAWSFDFGSVWAGENGIFAYINGQVVDLTDGKINREWRQLTDGFDFGTSDYCSIGEVSGHLIVSLVTDGGTTNRGYIYDLRDGAWMSRITNHKSRYFFSSKVPGEVEKLLWVGDNDQGRVMNSAGAINLTGLAKDGDGDSPRLQAWTGTNLTGGIENLDRVIDLQVHANVLDAGAAGATKMDVSVVSGGGIGNPADSTKTLTAINSDTVDRIDRHTRKVARKGRLHQVRLDVSTLGTNTAATKVEIDQISASIRDSRVRA